MAFQHPARNDAIYFDLIRRSMIVVNADGSVWHFRGRRFHVVHPSVNEQGYRLVRLRFDGKRRSIALHRLVWMGYNRARIPDGHDVHHKDEDVANNRPDNLEPRLPADHRANGTSFGRLAEYDDAEF